MFPALYLTRALIFVASALVCDVDECIRLADLEKHHPLRALFSFALSLSSKKTFVILDIIGQCFLKNIGVTIFDYHTTASFGECKFHVTMLQHSTIKQNR